MSKLGSIWLFLEEFSAIMDHARTGRKTTLRKKTGTIANVGGRRDSAHNRFFL